MNTAPAYRVILLGAFLLATCLAVALWLTGVPALTSTLLAVLVAWQSLGGFLIWRSIRQESSALEVFGVGIAIGTAMAALAGLITSTFGWGPWGSLVPTLVTLAFAYRARSVHTQTATPTDRWEISAFLATLAAGLAVFFYALRSYPLTWTGTWTGYHPDMAFFEALANSLARFGAFESPFMSGATVKYHWLSYAWTGQLSVVTDAAPFVGITRVLPLVSLLGSAAIVVAWTRRMSAASWTPFLAGALLTVSGFVGAVFGGVLTMDSPSQAMSVLWLLAFTVAASRAFKNRPNARLTTLAALLAISITLGKVSAAAPALAAVLLTAVVLVAHRSLGIRHALVVTTATVLPIGITFLAFLAGSAGGGGLEIGSLIDRASSQQGLNPLDGPRGVILGTAVLILAVAPRWAGVIELVVDSTWRWRSETWISLGLIASSLGALVLFNGFNEVWFSVSVSGPLAVTSAVGAGLALQALQTHGRPRTATLLTAIGTAAGVLFAITYWAWSTGASGGNLFVGTQRWFGPVIAWAGALLIGILLAIRAGRTHFLSAIVAGSVLILVFVALPGRLLGIGSNQIGALENGIRNEWFNVSQEGRVAPIDQAEVNDWTDSKMEASNVLRNEAAPTDLVATNVTRSPFVAGTTHLPTFVSGMVYQYAYGPPHLQQDLTDRERAVWDFVNEPQANNAKFLCDEGINWLWIDKQRTEQRAWLPFANPIFDNDEVTLAKVDESRC